MKRFTLLLFLFLTACLQNAISQQKTEQPEFYKTEEVQDIKITFDSGDWRSILDSLRLNNAGYLEGTVEINGQKFENAGVQYRGTKSITIGARRNPFNIQLDYKNEDQQIAGYTTIKLSNALRDPSLVREVLGYEIARTYMPAPWANYARLTVNGEYYGLMVNIEPVQDKQFLKRYFGEADNAFFKAVQVHHDGEPEGCKKNIYGSLEYDALPSCYEYNFEKLSEHGTKDLMSLAKTLNEDIENIEDILNVDETLWMLAFNNILVNLSSYSGQHSINYYLYMDESGRFTPIIWDMNLAFGSFKNIGTGSDLKTRQLYSLDPLLHIDNSSKPLISKLLAVDRYKKAYLSHLRTILYDYFVNDKYLARAQTFQELINTDVINDQNRFYDLDDFGNSLDKVIGKKSKIPGIAWLMDKRASFLKSHPELTVFPPEIVNIDVATRKPLSSQQVENFKFSVKADRFPKRVMLFYKLDDSQAYNRLNMIDAGNGVFEATVVPRNGERSITYFIVAENAGLMGFSPSNYMWEQHNTTLEELNK